MSPNFHYSLSRTQVPFSLIPVLPITEQIRIVHSVLCNLINIENSNQKKFLKIVSQVKESNFIEIFNTFKPIGNRLWKYHNICFMYNPKMVPYDLFMEKHGLTILKIVRNTLKIKTIEWVCLIQQEAIFMFTLSSNGFLLWSPLLKGIAPYFLASILSENSILDSIDDSWRWDFLEKEKSQLLNFVNMGFRNNLQTLENKESLILYFFFLMRNLLKVKENFISGINRELSLISSCDNYNKILKINTFFHHLLKKQDFHFYESFLSPSGLTEFNERFCNIPLKEYHWIFDVSPILFLEVIPQIKDIGDYQESGEYYTPIALAETIVSRSFETFIDQGLTKPITSIKVFDPAMGTGILMVFAIEWLVNFLISNISQDDSFISLRRKCACSNISGLDIDKNSITIYKMFLRSFYLLEMENEELEFKLEENDFVESFVASIESKQTFPKFDIIISNPPYLAFHSRFTKNLPSSVKLETLRRLIPVFSGKRDNTYLIFLGICLQQFLDPGGVVGVVIDHSFLDLPSYKRIRKHLLSNYHVSYILANYSYRKTAIVDLSLLVIKNTQNTLPTIWQETLKAEFSEVPREYFLSQPNFSFQHQKSLSLLSHLDAITIPLGKIASASCGLEYGALLKTHFLSSVPNKGFYKCIDGSNGLTHSYFLFWTPGKRNSYVRFDKEYEKNLYDTNQNVSKSNKRVILISGNLERFLTDKIILRQTAAKFIATLDTKKYLTLRNTHLIYHPKPPYSLNLILGIFCSSLGNFIGERLNIIRKPRKNSSRYPQIRLNDLKKFPIIDINQMPDTSLVNQVELAVEECLSIGESITTALTSLWVFFQESGISQRQYLKASLNRNLLTLFPVKEDLETVKQWDLSIEEDLMKLAAKRKEIDSLVFRLYNISQEDQNKIR